MSYSFFTGLFAAPIGKKREQAPQPTLPRTPRRFASCTHPALSLAKEVFMFDPHTEGVTASYHPLSYSTVTHYTGP